MDRVDLTQYNRVYNERLENVVARINDILNNWDTYIAREDGSINHHFTKTSPNKDIIIRMTHLMEAVGFSSGLYIHVYYIQKKKKKNEYDIYLNILKMNDAELESLNDQSDSDSD